jgi:hypothetical protein
MRYVSMLRLGAQLGTWPHHRDASRNDSLIPCYRKKAGDHVRVPICPGPAALCSQEVAWNRSLVVVGSKWAGGGLCLQLLYLGYHGRGDTRDWYKV